MKPKAHGIEIEWGSVVQENDGSISKRSLNWLWHYLPAETTYLGSGSSLFMGNGCRFYVDVGDHVETATAENISFVDTVAQEIACEDMILGAFQAAVADGKIKNFKLNKRVIDEKLNTWGAHESYSVDRKKISLAEQDLALFGLFNVVSNLYFGSGAIVKLPGQPASFSIAQKVHGLHGEVGQGTTNKSKTVINTRNETLANAERFIRVHNIANDPNLSPWAMRNRRAMASLVLRYLETPHTPSEVEQMKFKLPLHEIGKLVALDTTFKHPLELASAPRGQRSITAHEVLTEILTTLRKFTTDNEVPAEEVAALEQAERANMDFAIDPMRLGGYCDWAARLKVLMHYMDKHRLDWDSEEVAKKDRLFDEISNQGIARNKLRQQLQGWREWMPPKDLVQTRRTDAPGSTRANIRGKFINAFHGTPSDIANADWVCVKHERETINLNNPYATEDTRVHDLISQFGKTA